MDGGALLKKTVGYRIIALIFSMLFTYFILRWSDNHPDVDLKSKSVIIGIAGWLLGSTVYYIFEIAYNQFNYIQLN